MIRGVDFQQDQNICHHSEASLLLLHLNISIHARIKKTNLRNMTIFKMCSVTSWSIHENMASSSMSGAGPDGSTQVEDEVSLPRAAVNKMIKEMIPNIRVSNDARELILTCCKEFIHLVSSEANDICNVQTKKTISPDHIIAALGRLGFNQYLEEIKGVHAQFKSQASNKKKSNRLENLGRFWTHCWSRFYFGPDDDRKF